MGYTRDVIKGISWIGALRVSTRLLTVVRTALLARILAPHDFGLFGITTIVLSLLEAITETGVNIVLIQEKQNIDKYINSAWIVSIIRGAIIALLIIAFSPIISAFFNSSESLNLLLLISLVPFIRGFINPSVVKFQKDLRFNLEFIYSFLSFFVFFATAIIIALITKDTISLILALIASALFEVLASNIFVKPSPRIELRKEYLLKLVHRGKWLTVTGIASYLYQSIDNIAIGRILGTSSLGLYDVLYKISLLPLTEITDVVGKATFPVYIKMNGDLARLRRAYLRSVALIFVLSAGVGLFLFLFSEIIILFVLGEKWLAGAPVLKVLSVLGVLRALYASIIHPLYALEKQNLVTGVSFFGLMVLAAIIVPFIMFWGIVGAALAALVGTVVALPLGFYFVNRELTKKK